MMTGTRRLITKKIARRGRPRVLPRVLGCCGASRLVAKLSALSNVMAPQEVSYRYGCMPAESSPQAELAATL
jgi:hypothetical protein